MTFNPTPYDFFLAILHWGIVAGVVFGAMLLVGLLAALLTRRSGALSAVGGQISEGFTDMARTSPRRVWALAVLTFRESVRRKALLVFAIFAVLFMFAGWFMPEGDLRPDLQVKNHVSFVLRTIAWFILPVMLLLACWGLPEDIKARSLHTVVTKPARKNEIVIGRMLGFTMVGTLILAIMGLVGYVWVVRQVPTEAQANLISRVPVFGELTFRDREGRPSERGINTGDIWEFRSFIEGATRGRAIWTFKDVTPAITVERITESGERVPGIRVESRFEAFRTHKGEDRTTNEIQPLLVELQIVKDLRERTALALGAAKDFRSIEDEVRQGNFHEAGTILKSRADGLDKQQLKLGRGDFRAIADGHERFTEVMEPLRESRPDDAWIGEVIGASRKCAAAGRAGNSADLAAGLTALGDLFREHADALGKMLVNAHYRHESFRVSEFSENQTFIPREVDISVEGEASRRTGDVFEDLAHGDELQIHALCLDPGQFLGMGRPDLFIRTPDRPFVSGYTKAVVGIWLTMVLIVVIGVTASTFSKGPVAALLTFTVLIVGSQPAYGFLEKLVHADPTERVKGAGTFESAYRLVKHMNPQIDIEDDTGRTVLTVLDAPLNGLRWLVHRAVPNLDTFNMSERVANGFDVPWAEEHKAMLPSLMTTLGYLLPCLVLSYYSLKLRELEAK